MGVLSVILAVVAIPAGIAAGPLAAIGVLVLAFLAATRSKGFR